MRNNVSGEIRVAEAKERKEEEEVVVKLEEVVRGSDDVWRWRLGKK